MTLTAPIQLPPLDLRGAILDGLHPITATVHVDPPRIGRSTMRELDRALIAAKRTAYAALEKNLEPAGFTLDDGVADLRLVEEPHGDGWILSAVWSPL